MRSLIQKAVWWLMSLPLFKTVIHSVAKQDELHGSVQIEDYLMSKNGGVLKAGPFPELRYPHLKHYGMQILASKYLGTFELEIQPVITEIISRHYTTAHNIGSADGYYSVGFAMKGIADKVIAWEMLPEMQVMTKQVATLNNVESKIEIRGICTEELLRREKTQGPTLVFSDCEGAENELLTHENLQGMAPYDILVECHDLFSPDVTAKLITRFSPTHDIQRIETALRTLDDIPQHILKQLPFKHIQIARAIEEPRLFRMSWLWMKQRV